MQAFNKLADNVHPLALGNVKRSLSQSRMMAKKLLALHMNVGQDEHRINDIVDSLTSKLYYHGHPINRQEAKEQVDLQTIDNPTDTVEDLMWQLYLDYEQEIKMEEPFNPASEFITLNPTLTSGVSIVTPLAIAKLAFIESKQRTDALSLSYQLSGQKQPDDSVTVQLISQGVSWQVEP